MLLDYQLKKVKKTDMRTYNYRDRSKYWAARTQGENLGEARGRASAWKQAKELAIALCVGVAIGFASGLRFMS